MTQQTAAEWVQHGLGFHQQGDLASAEACYQRALEADPASFNALHFFGMAKFQQGEPEAAEELIRQSIDLRPDSPLFRYNFGQFLENQNRLDEALWAYEYAFTLDPTMAAALNERGRILQQVDRGVEAEAAYRQVLEIEPDMAAAHTNLGVALWSQGDLPGALDQLTQACAKDPEQLLPHIHLVALLLQMGRAEHAVEAAEKARQIGLSHPLLEVKQAEAEKEVGSQGKAAARLEAVLQDDPRNFEALYTLAPLAGRLDVSFPQREAESLFHDPHLDRDGRSLLGFSLGAYSDSRKEHDAAFLYWLEANQAEEEQADARKTEQLLSHWRELRKVYSKEVIDQLATWGDQESEPIFVVGTPRSGTTLIEQILASHSRVTGVGESGLVEGVLRDYLGINGNAEGGGSASSLSPERCSELGAAYMHKLRELAPGADRIVEKTPGNAHNLGLIRALFPNARVIFASRDPLDSGISMFSLRFSQSVDFSFDLETLGRYLHGFQEQMGHWQKVLPSSFLLKVEYEDLVTDPGRWVREMLAHCGLEWEEECLRFFETKRTVRTASMSQVRQPIYKSSVKRWPRYAIHIRPLARAAGLEERLPTEAREEFRSFSRLGERQLARGQMQDAIHSFRRAMMWEPSRRGRINVLLGQALERAERFQEAEACFRAAGEAGIDPEPLGLEGDLELARVRCLRKMEGMQKAAELLEARPVCQQIPEKLERAWLALWSGELQGAQSQFEEVLEERQDEEAWQGWLQVTEQLGRTEEAQEMLASSMAERPESALPIRLFADLLLQQEKFEQAEPWVARALELAPHCHKSHMIAAAFHYNRDRLDAAEHSVNHALSFCPDHLPAHLIAARIHLAQGQFRLAHASAREALGVRDNYEARTLWGRTLILMGSGEAGLAEIRKARRGYSREPSFWFQEAGALEELNRRAEAMELLQTARERFPEDEDLRFLELQLLRQEGATAEALEGLLSLPESFEKLPRYHSELGFLYDRRGEVDRAMGHFQEANDRFAARSAARRFPKEVSQSRIARLKSSMNENWVRHWRVSSRPTGWENPPVFLLGFPRSGTTLLDQVLSSHSQMAVIEEKPAFEAVLGELRRQFGGDLKGLVELTDRDIAELQEFYRRTLAENSENPENPMLVDKMPLRTVDAGMVYRLFPDARFIFARRHPADCVLSAFMQLFVPNTEMANFHSLAAGSNYYRAVMELWGQIRWLFPGMQVHEVRYEELVEDFDGVVGALLDFLGLPWEEGVRAYRDTARGRGRVATPSRTQVTQPLYQHARYRWRRYREYFGEAWEELLPFIRAAGYSEN
ncbi:sulfotransferase [Thiohalorhabdus methylotrophus]|uniref:Sulfotransferase n=1 Tax=Thiohalorhabdus methylotrophus TaxID=3242694 RepID=A0ABV4TS22_9GAMM